MGRKIGYRVPIESRIKQRNTMHTKFGGKSGYIEEALDLYLSGSPVEEISMLYGVGHGAIYSGIAKAALYRLMLLHAKDRVDQLDEIT